nr:FHA domain-containing protein [uncultured Anaerobutyricum sp.]
MSIISQIGVVILIAFIVLVLFRSNKNLKKASEEGENFVDEWALRQEKKEEIRQKKEEKKLETQKKKEYRKLQKKQRSMDISAEPEEEYPSEPEEFEEFYEEDQNQEYQEEWKDDRQSARQDSWDDQPGYDGESLRVNADWLYDYEEKEKKHRERIRPEQSEMSDYAPENNKIVPIKKKETTGITLMRLDANHRVMARYRVSQIPFTIGRSSNNDLVLDDLCVARNHCRIVERDGRYILEDVGTMNKIFVNGMVTAQVPLSDGLRIYIGNEEFQIAVEGGRSQSTRLYKNVEGSYE